MKTFFIILFYVAAYLQVFSQSIIWESEYLMNDFVPDTDISSLIDKEGNFVCLLRDCTPPTLDYNFIKYDQMGELQNYQYSSLKHLFMPLGIYDKGQGYKIIGGIATQNTAQSGSLLPVVMETDSTGLIDKENYPYDYKDSSIFEDHCFKLIPPLKIINKDGSFITCNLANQYRINDSTTGEKLHIIISKYNNDGTIDWRAGYDTIGLDPLKPMHYMLKDFFKKKNGTLILLNTRYYANSGDFKETIILISVFDSTGKRIRSFEYTDENNQYYGLKMVECSDGNMIMLGKYLNNLKLPDKKSGYFLWKINDEGEVILKKEITVPESFLNLDFIYNTPDSNIIVSGWVVKNDTTPNDPKDNYYKLLLMKYNYNLNLLWDFRWYEYQYKNATGIRDIKFLDHDNFVIMGYKDRSKFFISKINDKTTNVRDPALLSDINVRPNPFCDYLELTLNNYQDMNCHIAMYDIMGREIKIIGNETVITSNKRYMIDCRNLRCGTYYITINDGKNIVTRKVVKNSF